MFLPIFIKYYFSNKRISKIKIFDFLFSSKQLIKLTKKKENINEQKATKIHQEFNNIL